MTKDVYYKSQTPIPPPLPEDNGEEDMATIPADSPWQVVPAVPLDTTIADGETVEKTEYVQQDHASDDASPPPDDGPGEAPLSNPPAKAPRRQRKLMLGLLIPTITMFATAAVLLIFQMIDENESKTPEVGMTLVEPKIIEKDTTPKAFAQKSAEIDAMFEQIAGAPLPLHLGKHQTAAELSRYILTADTPFARTVRDTLSDKIDPLTPPQFEHYENLWKLGVAVLDIATNELETYTTLEEAVADESAEKQAKTLNAWLIEWLLGRKGLYCELRDLFWHQVKTKRPSVGPNRKGQIAKLRKERREFAKAFGYPSVPLYKYCDSR